MLRFFNTSAEAVLSNLVPAADVAAILALRPIPSYAALHAAAVAAATAAPPSQLPQLFQRYQAAVEDGHDIDDLISQCEALSRKLRAAMSTFTPARRRPSRPVPYAVDLTSHVSESDDDEDAEAEAEADDGAAPVGAKVGAPVGASTAGTLGAIVADADSSSANHVLVRGGAGVGVGEGP